MRDRYRIFLAARPRTTRTSATPLAMRIFSALTVAALFALAALLAATTLRRFLVRGGARRLLGPRDRLANRLLDRGDGFRIRRLHDRHRGAAASGAAGAADAMHIIVRMMRDVEIEHVAH